MLVAHSWASRAHIAKLPEICSTATLQAYPERARLAPELGEPKVNLGWGKRAGVLQQVKPPPRESVGALRRLKSLG